MEQSLSLIDLAKLIPALSVLRIDNADEYDALVQYWVHLAREVRMKGVNWLGLELEEGGAVRSSNPVLTEVELTILYAFEWGGLFAELSTAYLLHSLTGENGEKPLRLLIAIAATQSIMRGDNPVALKRLLCALIGKSAV